MAIRSTIGPGLAGPSAPVGRRPLAWAVLVALLLVGCGGSGSEPAAVRAAIDQANERLVAAVLAGNADAAAESYTEDAVLLPPGAPPVEGRAAIREFWAGVDVAAFVLRTEALEVAGGQVAERGTWALTLRDPEGNEQSRAGSYVVVWRNAGDAWRLHWDIWNAD